MDKILKYLMLLLVTTLSFTFTACSDDDDEPDVNQTSIVGTWGDSYGTITFGKDGSYRENGNDGQYRIGTYSYSASAATVVVDIKAIAGNNSAYQNTYFVQTLSATTLVLLYTDGDVKGYYTRR